MTTEDKFLKAVQELRKSEKKRKFSQSIDLIVNLKNFDARRESLNIFVSVPNKIKEKKIAAFFERRSNVIDTIIKDEFVRFKDKKDLKKLARSYDAFMASPKLMPSVATTFGRVLGPFGKMPSPQLGLAPNEDDNTVKAIANKINTTVRVKTKEPCVKVSVARESMTDKEIAENIYAVYKKIVESLPKQQENVRNIKIKLTMDKPVKVEM